MAKLMEIRKIADLSYETDPENDGDYVAEVGSILLAKSYCEQLQDAGYEVSWSSMDTTMTDARGTRTWYRDGQLHRDGDEPAMIYADGTRWWYRDGQPHRDGDEPAMIYADGTRWWYRDGQPHRDGDKPAVIDANRTRAWYRDGQRHRDGDEPAVIDANGTREWWRNGQLHRDGDEPAVIRAGETRRWYVGGTPVTPGAYVVLAHDAESGYSLVFADGRYRAGCREFSRAEALSHWRSADTARARLFVAAIETHRPT